MIEITGTKVLTGGQDIGPSRVVVEHGRITAVEPLAGPADHAIVAPGLVDLQVNGFDEIDVATTDVAGFNTLDQRLENAGTTSWCPTVTTRPLASYGALLDRLDRWSSDRSSVIGIHLEGPFLGGSPGAHDLASITGVDMNWLTTLPDSVRLLTLAPEAVDAEAATQFLTARDVRVALGHTSATTEETEACVNAGASLVTHCFNGMRPLHHRDPGPVGVALANDNLTVSLIGDLVHVHPVALRLALAAKPPGRVILVSDAIGWRSPVGLADGMHVTDGAPRLADGTIAGTNITLLDAVRNVAGLGIDLAQVMMLATQSPAAVMGLTDRGVLEPGTLGHVLALDDSLQVERVVAG